MPSVGLAQSLPGTALIVRVPGDERIYIPLRAELGSYRFRVLELPDRPGRRSEALSELASARDAQAALRARPESMSVELWVQTEAGGQSEEVVSAGPGRNPDVLALRVTEAMRARGLELPPPSAAGPTARAADEPTTPARPVQPAAGAPAPPATPAQTPPPAAPATAVAQPPAEPTATPPKPAEPAAPKPEAPPAKASVAPPPPPSAAAPDADEADEDEVTAAVSSNVPEQPPLHPLLFVEAAPLGVISTNSASLGPAVDALVQVRLQPYASSSLSLFGFIPLWQAPLEGVAGRTVVRAWAIGGFADFHVPIEPIELTAGLGAASLLVTLDGEPGMPPSAGGSDLQRIAAFLGRAGMSIPLTRELRLNARVMAGLTVPELRVGYRTMGSTVTEARWGRVLVIASLGLELGLPWER